MALRTLAGAGKVDLMALSETPEAPDLHPAHFVDSEHPDIRAWAQRVTEGAIDDREKAGLLYLWVRDQIRYDPYVASSDPHDFVASTVLAKDRNWCVPKAVLLCAGARAVGVPSRLGFADVRNHLASEKLLEKMGSDLFVFHGYVEMWLDRHWRKATPAFNVEMCTRFGVKPLDFDGTADSLYHPFDVAGRRHMEYVAHRGTYRDLPLQEMQQVFAEVYGEGSLLDPDRDQDGAGQVGASDHDAMFHA